MSMGAANDAIGAIEDAVARGADADDVLRAAVAALAAEPLVDWAGIAFLDEGEHLLGPSAGSPDEARRRATTIVYRGQPVGELLVDGSADSALLEQIASRLSEYVLLGWDTGGSAWDP